METKKTFKYNYCTQENTSDIIDGKAKEKGLGQGKSAIFCRRESDKTFTDADGYEITVGYRVDKFQRPTEFIIKNRYKKRINDKAQKSLEINND
jgi:hypothetical protein